MAAKNQIPINVALASFKQEVIRLKDFDLLNQQKFSNNELTRAQIELLVESIFFTCFRSFENFLGDVFILYCIDKQPSKLPKVKSYLKPKDYSHAELMIKSSMERLDWTSPDRVIQRAEMYLANDGYPIKLPITTNRQQLKDFKVIRNHIAHNSSESKGYFIKVVQTFNNGIQPINIPSPGSFLMYTSKKNHNNYLLLDFFDLMLQIAEDLT
jgi:hypothetical protein